EFIRHGFDEARLPASRRPLQQDRQALTKRRAEHLLLVPDRDVVRPRGFAHALFLSIRRRSRVRSVRWKVRRWTEVQRNAARNSGPAVVGSCSAVGIAACAAVPKTRRRSSTCACAPMLRHTHAVPRRRASESARLASASPYAPSYPWSYAKPSDSTT